MFQLRVEINACLNKEVLVHVSFISVLPLLAYGMPSVFVKVKRERERERTCSCLLLSLWLWLIKRKTV